MKILSIVCFKRFAQDEMTALFSPDEVNNILLQYSTDSISLIRVRAYVGSKDEIYVPDFIYGTNSCVIGQKPSDTHFFYVPSKDITLIRKANIDLDIL